jgi:hypothetical protein
MQRKNIFRPLDYHFVMLCVMTLHSKKRFISNKLSFAFCCNIFSLCVSTKSFEHGQIDQRMG